MVRLHITVITGNVTFAHNKAYIYYRDADVFREGEVLGKKEKSGVPLMGIPTGSAPFFALIGKVHFTRRPQQQEQLSALTAGAVKDEEQENDDDDPRKSVVLEEVAKASHDKPPGFSAVF